MSIPDENRTARENYKKKIKFFRIELYPTETDIINRLDEVPNKQGYIKKLIRQDILNRAGK